MTPHELLSDSSWFPAAVAAALSPCDALALASAAPQFRCVRLRATPVAQASAEWYGPADVYAAFRWQPLPPVDPARTHTAFVDATWKDQGWGNRKGMISVVAGLPRRRGKPVDFAEHPLACLRRRWQRARGAREHAATPVVSPSQSETRAVGARRRRRRSSPG